MSNDQQEALLGLATTDELMRELIARFEVHSTTFEFESILNANRARTLSNLLFGMSPEEKAYRTVDS